MNRLKRFGLIAVAVAVLTASSACDIGADQTKRGRGLTLQKDILRVQLFDSVEPDSYELIDWREKALQFDRLVFDAKADGAFLPLIWEDKTHGTFGLPAYVGDPRYGRDGAQEAVTNIAAVLSGTLLGLNKADYVDQLAAFYSEEEKIILNNPSGSSATTSMWYLLYPTILFAHVYDLYEDHGGLRERLLAAIDSWYRAYEIMAASGEGGSPDFNYTGFDFRTMQPYRNGVWTEPDSAAGIGLLMYYGYRLTGDEKYLAASLRCMEYIGEFFGSPLYEVLMYFAPYLAAKLNALHGAGIDLEAVLNDTLTSTAIPRGGWGMIIGKWGDYPMNGLLGSTTDGGGYAFAMNTFAGAAAVAPTVRYDVRYARDIGVWMLHLASNARYFLAGETEEANQSCTYAEPCKGIDRRIREAVPYEGIRKSSQGKTPWFGGDPTVYGWAETDFSLYSGAHMGMFASMVEATNVDRILRIDLSATRFFDENDEPSALLYNPYPGAKKVEYRIASEGPVDLFDAVTNTVVARGVSGKASLDVPGGDARVIVEIPAGANVEQRGADFYANGKWISRGVVTLHVSGPEGEGAVSGPFTLKAEWTANYPAEPEAVTVQIDDRSFEFAPDEPIRLDAGKFAPGSKRVLVTLTMKDGTNDQSSIRLKFQ